jgi:hypothetical protein
MTSNQELQIRFLLFLEYKIPGLMSYLVPLMADNPYEDGIFSYKDILQFFQKYLKSHPWEVHLNFLHTGEDI